MLRFRPWMLLLPLILLLAPTSLAPFFYAIYISLFRYVIASPAPVIFVGLNNYVKILGDEMFANALLRGILFSLSCVSIQIIIGFIIALFLQKVSGKLSTIARVVLCIPLAAPPIVIGTMWKLMLNPDVGPLPFILRIIGVHFNIGQNPAHAFFATVLMDTWHWTPLVALILLSGLVSIPPELYEVADVNGATMLHKLRYVTIPLIKQEFLIAALIRFMDSLRIFDEVWMLTAGGPGGATQYLGIYIYRLVLSQWDLGYGSAVSIVSLYLIVVVSMILFRVIMGGKS